MVKYYFFVGCGICFFINDTYSQNQKIVDSLTSVLENKIGGERYPPLYELAFEYIDIDYEKALEIIQQAEQAALLAGDSLWIVKSKRVKGQILYRLEKIEESIKIFKSILPIALKRKFTKECTMIVNNLASSYLFEGKYDMALQFYFQTLELGKELEDTTSIAMGLHNIGLAYYKLTDYKKALNYFKRSFTIHKSMHDVKYNILTNISLCYAYLNDFSNAQLYVEESLNACRENCPDNSMMQIKFAMGFISFGLKQYDRAENDFLTSYSFSKKLNNSRFQFDNIFNLSKIYIKQNRIKTAELYLGEAEKLIRQGTPFNLEVINIYSGFSQLYRKTKNFEKASHYQLKYIQLKDSVYNEELTTNLMKTEAEYMERENTAKIATQSEIILLKEEIINRQWILNIITGFLGFMTLTFLIFLFRNYQQKKNLNLMLDKKIEERTRELELSRDELLNAFKERDILIYRASEGITETINTIKGLCFIGIKDVSDPVARSYIDKIDKTSHHLASHLKSLFQERIVVSAF